MSASYEYPRFNECSRCDCPKNEAPCWFVNGNVIIRNDGFIGISMNHKDCTLVKNKLSSRMVLGSFFKRRQRLLAQTVTCLDRFGDDNGRVEKCLTHLLVE